MSMRMRLETTPWLAWALLTLTAVCLCAGAQDAAPPTAGADNASSKRPDFEAFRILVERNIFDAARTGASHGLGPASAPPTDVLRLIGAWIDGSRALALFEDGAGSPWETVGPGASIAGYRVEQIRTDAAVLRNEQQTLELRVGSGLAKGADGAWHVLETRPDPPAPTADDAPRAGNQPAIDATPQPPPAASDPGRRNAHSANGTEQTLGVRPRRHMRKEFRP